ncbi:hypothetical protein [Synechococcus sp. PCC 7336]|uniref:ATPase, T2SS/T4P/T4SS family n=1 Tax=Synechococcus sp. PCC 7336 TaxID=195250 RepID=UPI000477DA6B|nr:hypothetical protein [Synechococcus sp. PCC 7336]
MLNLNDTTALVATSANLNKARVPILIATYLPVEICVYYQVVPIDIEENLLFLGMVDPGDLAALDYVGKMLAFSQLQIHVHPISFDQHQELIAHYFNNPPEPERIAAYKAEVMRTVEAKVPPSDADRVAEADRVDAVPAAEANGSKPPEAVESVQQLLNSMLRRALDEEADRIFIEFNDNGSCRVRYRQKGILRDMFKELSDTIRAQLILNLKQMVGMDESSGDRQSAAVEKVYRGQPLLLQLRIITQEEREAAILNILQGGALAKYQKQQNQQRAIDTVAAIGRAQQELSALKAKLADTIHKIGQYSANQQPQPEWIQVSSSLDALMLQARQIRQLQKEWLDLQRWDKKV